MDRRASRKKQIPHEKRLCHRCHGTGRAPCAICGGSGEVAKGTDATGRPKFGRCEGCLGTRTARCPTCGGERFI